MKHLVLVFLLVGCGTEVTPDFVTELGWQVWTSDPVNAEDIDAATLATLDAMGIQTLPPFPSLTFVSWPFPCEFDGVEYTCLGTAGKANLKVAWQPCLPNSSFVHELIHWLRWWRDGIYDNEHPREIFDVRGSLEWTINEQLRPELCP